MIHSFTWVAQGVVGACRCGGKLIRYDVEPKRSPLYVNHAIVCDNPDCQESVVHAGTSRERRGRLLLAS